jgi:hypothetical protein
MPGDLGEFAPGVLVGLVLAGPESFDLAVEVALEGNSRCTRVAVFL